MKQDNGYKLWLGILNALTNQTAQLFILAVVSRENILPLVVLLIPTARNAFNSLIAVSTNLPLDSLCHVARSLMLLGPLTTVVAAETRSNCSLLIA